MENYNKILDRVYELEGLLLLALSKDDNLDSIEKLISNKVREISDLTASEGLENSGEETAGMSEEPDCLAGLVYEEPTSEIIPDTSLSVPLSDTAPLFSLNDKFIYIRELFGGDEKLFDKAMDNVAAFDSYDEAEGYFLSEYDWDPDNSVASGFLKSIGGYFGKIK